MIAYTNTCRFTADNRLLRTPLDTCYAKLAAGSKNGFSILYRYITNRTNLFALAARNAFVGNFKI